MQTSEVFDVQKFSHVSLPGPTVTHTSFDMDPFTIISFGQKIFRTRVARHSLNPVWDEKLLFHVRRHESNFQIKFAIYDWDKMSANDYVGGASINVMDLINAAPKPDPKTGLYAPTEDGIHGMATFELPLARVEKDEDVKYGGKHAPVLTVEAKFTPYDALRQRFWRQLLEQYDTNDSNSLSQLELTSMLDSLGSTLTTQTIESWFSQIGKNPNDDDLTVDEAIKALEAEIMKPYSEKQYVQGGESLESGTATPADAHLELAAAASSMDNTGPKAPTASEDSLAKRPHGIPVPATVVDDSAVHETADKTEAVIKPVTMDKLDPVGGSMSSSSTPMEGSSSMSLTGGTPSSARREGSSDSLSLLSSGPEGSVERVIVLKSCPLCHMPRLSKKAEVDIVTHLAVCASQDWRRINSMVVGNFVTASQAHRKWYTRVITKISQGNYQLGANSANIIVQDRLTGELQEEKMQVYVRLGIRLLYKGAKSRMEGARVRRMLRNMSVKQGVKFDSPASAREIAPFIAFHNLNVDEILDPIDSFGECCGACCSIFQRSLLTWKASLSVASSQL